MAYRAILGLLAGVAEELLASTYTKCSIGTVRDLTFLILSLHYFSYVVFLPWI